MQLSENVALAGLTTLGVGGPARFLLEVTDETTLLEALRWAQARGLTTYVLGGGSNLLVADAGVDGVVLRLSLRGRSHEFTSDGVEIEVAAGEVWDDVVSWSVERGWAGIECLSGIPGLAGATPIQNVGAYGQEVGGRIVEVRAVDRQKGEIETLPARACCFAYRDSLFKRAARDRYVVTRVRLRLTPGAAPEVRYPELAREIAARAIASPALLDVRQTVLDLRRRKSMLLDPDDPDSHSCGSFFLNPLVSATELALLAERAADPSMPRFAQPDGRYKLSAAWLIEHAGLARGFRTGNVGLSTRHALAVVAYQGASAAEVVGFARTIRDRVEQTFGVRLEPEPDRWGFHEPF